MKFIMSLSLTLLSLSSIAQAKEPTVFCKSQIKEEGQATEVYNFVFKCDNYGEGTTFTSKSGRYTVSAFSTESCTPELIVHDSKTNVASTALGSSDKGKGFDIFTNKLVLASSAEVQKENLGLNPDLIKNKAFIACSTDKTLLEDIE